MNFKTLVLLLTTVSTALIGGLFYAYSCSVIPGLARLSDTSFLQAMQSINRAILNPLFFISFMGALVLLPLSVWFFRDQAMVFYLLLAATLLYFGGVFLVTIIGNVPLNNLLDGADLDKLNATDLTALRDKFEPSWNLFHRIRTIVSFICIVLVAYAAILSRNA
ncbi:putative membrane protein [Pedobacter sp. W3I1]|uniref:anthrone oxygenase family protein n=1 Tax=Pedobacter sp. W3I1 TaxID=3042291 RepID=UPI0027839B9B|nr:anthrone oxygenase family protein [Pedobacter sp. W3I1]MDQ0638924.1 putative membrane protein [Pedobacter sp. W3I1]